MQKTYTIYDKLAKTELDETFTGGLDAQFDAEDFVAALAKEEGRDRDDYEIFVTFPTPAQAHDDVGSTAEILRDAARIRRMREEMIAELDAMPEVA